MRLTPPKGAAAARERYASSRAASRSQAGAVNGRVGELDGNRRTIDTAESPVTEPIPDATLGTSARRRGPETESS